MVDGLVFVHLHPVSLVGFSVTEGLVIVCTCVSFSLVDTLDRGALVNMHNNSTL